MKLNQAIVMCMTVSVLLALYVVPCQARIKGTQSIYDLPAGAQLAVAEAVGRDNAAYHAADNAGGYSFSVKDDLTARFTRGGAVVSGWQLSLAAVGRGDSLAVAAVVQPVAQANRVEYRRGNVTEWYVNSPMGLEQGFTVRESPLSGTGTLVLALQLPAGMTPSIDDRTSNLVLAGRGNNPSLGYKNLAAWDAGGKKLAAWYELSGDRGGRHLLIRVDDKGATYPITVDPLIERQKLTADDAATTDNFGYSVSLSGDGTTALIGAYSKNSNTGAAYLFTRNGSGWTQQQKLTATDGVANDMFGYAVSVSSDGSIALIGAVNSALKGAAYVFTKSGASWSLQQKLTADDGAAGDLFGGAVSLGSNGTIAVIGAAANNTNTGAGYIYTRSGITWTQQQKLTASDPVANSFFGCSVSLSADGNTSLIGGYGKNSYSGAAYIFTKSGATWNEQQKVVASDAVVNSKYGYSVALSGDGTTALVGAIDRRGAYVLVRNGSTWAEQQVLSASDGVSGDQFGGSVALNNDGSIAAVGAMGRNSNTGAAYIYTRSGATWSQQQTLAASDNESGALFGNSIALGTDGSIAVAGSPGKSNSTGTAYLVSVVRPCGDGQYDSGAACTPCAAGTWQVAGLNTSCVTAATGYFVAASGASAAVACPVGTYQPAVGQTTCFTAPIGTFVSASGATSSTYCSAGFYQDQPGQFSCKQCPLGRYQDSPGQSLCKSAPAGSIVSSAGATAYIPCAAGTVQPQAGQSSCQPCSVGYFQPDEGKQFCFQAPLGTSVAAVSSTFAVNCPAGSYQDQSGQTSCKPCAIGTYQPLSGQFFCLSVPAGTISPTTGATSATACPTGTYQDKTGQTVCTPCAAGTYQDLTGQAACKPASAGQIVANVGSVETSSCPAGTYQDLQGQSVCKQCAIGTYQDSPGQSVCKNAPAGHFTSLAGAAAPLPCPLGMAQNLSGQSVCVSCAAGEYQSVAGQASCVKAPAGYIVAAGGAFEPVACPAGSYQDKTGQTACSPCAAGTYQDTAGQAVCKQTPVGTYTTVAGAFSPLACAAGTFQSTAGNFTCYDCPLGMYQGLAGQAMCIQAPRGYYVATVKAVAALPCPAGTYQDQTGSMSCKNCPAGTLQPVAGQSSCLDIPKAVNSVVYDPSNLQKMYAGIDNSGVYISSDSGSSWTAAATQPANNRIKAIVVKPGENSTLFAATYGGGVYKSTDSAVTWTACSAQPTNTNMVSLTIDGTGKLYAGSEAGVFTSSDNCAAWSAMNSGLPL